MKGNIVIATVVLIASLILSLVLNDMTILLGMVIGLIGSIIKYWLTIMQTDRAIENVKLTGHSKSYMIFAVIRFLVDLLILVFAVKISLNALLAAFIGLMSIKFVLYSSHKKNKGVNH